MYICFLDKFLSVVDEHEEDALALSLIKRMDD